MKTAIQLGNMRFYAFHGVNEQENRVGNNYTVQLTVKASLKQAMLTDDISDTLNYAELYETVRKEMEIPSRLLEDVAGRIILSIQNRFPEIKGGKLTVTKEKPPISGDVESASVVIKW